ncbi:MAG TPA: hypoxanthine phosphoribosyltransferase [Alphaproteobacteria bacterium]|nr:hypoxanthine phosphoribosyltransferase [Alphaproteobacteria bacterium]
MIQGRLNALADDIARAMAPDLIAIAILKGSFIFAADLIRALHARGLSPHVDFMTLSSYGTATQSSGTVTLLRDAEIDVRGQQVLLLDDILDSGRTLAFASRHLADKGAATVKTCVLLDKYAAKGNALAKADFAAFACPDDFVVGYGMDYAHMYRELPFVAVLDQKGVRD